MVFNLQSAHKYMVEMAMFYVQRVITLQVGKPELRFMCSASHLIVLYICVKLSENTERTRVYSRNGYFQYLLYSMGCNSKSRSARVKGFVFCTLSYRLTWSFTAQPTLLRSCRVSQFSWAGLVLLAVTCAHSFARN